MARSHIPTKTVRDVFLSDLKFSVDEKGNEVIEFFVAGNKSGEGSAGANMTSMLLGVGGVTGNESVVSAGITFKIRGLNFTENKSQQLKLQTSEKELQARAKEMTSELNANAVHIEDLKKALASCDEKINAMKNETRTKLDRIQSLEEEAAAAKAALSVKTEEHAELNKMKGKYICNDTKVKEMLQEVGKMTRRIEFREDFFKKEKEKTKALVAEQDAKTTATAAQNTEMLERVAAMQAQCDEITSTADAKQAKNDAKASALEAQVADLAALLDQSKEGASTAEEAVAAAKIALEASAAEAVEKKAALHETQVQELSTKLAAVEEDAAATRLERDAARDAASQLEAATASSTETLAEAHAQLAELEGKVSESEAEVVTLRADLETALERTAALEEAVADSEEMTSVLEIKVAELEGALGDEHGRAAGLAEELTLERTGAIATSEQLQCDLEVPRSAAAAAVEAAEAAEAAGGERAAEHAAALVEVGARGDEVQAAMATVREELTRDKENSRAANATAQAQIVELTAALEAEKRAAGEAKAAHEAERKVLQEILDGAKQRESAVKQGPDGGDGAEAGRLMELQATIDELSSSSSRTEQRLVDLTKTLEKEVVDKQEKEAELSEAHEAMLTLKEHIDTLEEAAAEITVAAAVDRAGPDSVQRAVTEAPGSQQREEEIRTLRDSEAEAREELKAAKTSIEELQHALASTNPDAAEQMEELRVAQVTIIDLKTMIQDEKGASEEAAKKAATAAAAQAEALESATAAAQELQEALEADKNTAPEAAGSTGLEAQVQELLERLRVHDEVDVIQKETLLKMEKELNLLDQLLHEAEEEHEKLRGILATYEKEAGRKSRYSKSAEKLIDEAERQRNSAKDGLKTLRSGFTGDLPPPDFSDSSDDSGTDDDPHPVAAALSFENMTPADMTEEKQREMIEDLAKAKRSIKSKTKFLGTHI